MSNPDPPTVKPASGHTPAPAGADALEQAFDAESLTALRNTVAAHASAFGLSDKRVDELVLVVQELAANAVRHGAGHGSLRLWRTDHQLRCEVTDPGAAPADLAQAGLTPQPPSKVGGRGLWLVRQFTDDLDISTGAGGTTITASISLPAEGGAEAARRPV